MLAPGPSAQSGAWLPRRPHAVRVEPPKSRNGGRTLPLDDALVASLTALRKNLAGESENAESAYESRLSELT